MGDSKEGGTEWMYNQGKQVDEEDYLLGKRIGKDFDNEGTMGQINAVEYDCAPPSIFASKAQHQVDLQRKLVEDPLMAIKKRELEDRKRLLDNPMKMKALREHIETLKKAKKDKKKKKKKKKRRGSDSDESDTDLDLALLQKLEKIEGREAERDRKWIREEEEKERQAAPKPTVYSDKEEPDTPPRDSRKNRNYKNDKGDLKRDRNYSDRRSRSRSREYRRRRESPPASSHRRSRSREQYRRRSRSVEDRRRRSRSRDFQTKRRRSRSQDKPRRRSRSEDRGRGKKEDNKNDEKAAKKLSDEERAKKLAEMMDNAKWREEQRSSKVKQYRKKEEEEQNLADHDPEFLRRELRKAAANSSVESRIRSNKHNIQRGVGVMDSNFAKR